MSETTQLGVSAYTICDTTGMAHPRGSMSLANVAYGATFTWANPLMVELERQAQVPIFGTDPVELGITTQEELVEIVEKLAKKALKDPVTVRAGARGPATHGDVSLVVKRGSTRRASPAMQLITHRIRFRA